MIAWALIIFMLVMIFPTKFLAAIVILIIVGKIAMMVIEPPNMGNKGTGGSSGGSR